MPIADLIAALKARWRLELIVALLVAGLAIAVSLALPRTYVATATLLLDERPIDPSATAEQAQPADAAQVLATQADIIRSEDVARVVVRQQHMLADPVLLARWRKATGGVIDTETWLAKGLLSNLVVDTGNSAVLAVHYTAADARGAATMANAFAHAYLDTRLHMATDPARSYTRWFEVRIKEARDTLGRAQAALADFQRAHGILGSENINAEGDRLTALSQQLAQADATQADAAARAGDDRARSPDVQSTTVMQQLRTQIAQKTAEVAALRSTLGPNHPQLQGEVAELASLRERLASETGTMATSLSVASGDAASRTAQLRRLMEAQRARMFALQADRSQLEVLQRDVQSASASYDATSQNLNAMRLKAELPRANVRQLDEASAPLLSSSPNMPMRAVIGAILGGLLGVTLAAALEWWRPRVRTEAGLAEITGAPVLVDIDFGGSRAAAAIRAYDRREAA